MLQKLEIRNTLFGLRIWKQIFIFPKRWTLYSLNIKHDNFSLTLCSFDIYINHSSWWRASFGNHRAFYYELPPYIDLKYSNQGKQNKKKYTKIKTNAMYQITHTKKSRKIDIEHLWKRVFAQMQANMSFTFYLIIFVGHIVFHLKYFHSSFKD